MSEKLAILGGRPAVTADTREKWKRPIEEEKKLIYELLEEGDISGAGSGLPKKFEEEFREYVGCEYCLTVDHGSTALASAYYAVGNNKTLMQQVITHESIALIYLTVLSAASRGFGRGKISALRKEQ